MVREVEGGLGRGDWERGGGGIGMGVLGRGCWGEEIEEGGIGLGALG